MSVFTSATQREVVLREVYNRIILSLTNCEFDRFFCFGMDQCLLSLNQLIFQFHLLMQENEAFWSC